jgi:hypothetical protein
VYCRYYSASDLPDVIPEVGVASESSLPLSSITSGVLQDRDHGQNYGQIHQQQQQELGEDRGCTMSHLNSENEIPVRIVATAWL